MKLWNECQLYVVVRSVCLARMESNNGESRLKKYQESGSLAPVQKRPGHVLLVLTYHWVLELSLIYRKRRYM